MRILVIEDELKLRTLLRKGLREQGYAIDAVETGEEGLSAAASCTFDLILLDIGLPGCSGFDVARQLKAQNYPASILMLTAYDTEDDIVRGLDLGADDYMKKPFSFLELVARIRRLEALLPTTVSDQALASGIVLDTARQRVLRNGDTVHLTRTEFLLFERLAQQAGQTVLRHHLTEILEADGRRLGKTALDTYMCSLRRKLFPMEEDHPLQTVRGIGYRLSQAPAVLDSRGN